VQPLEGRRREHVFRAPPTPISFGPTGPIHPCFVPEVEKILQWSHRQRSRGRPREVDQYGGGLATLARRLFQIIPQDLSLLIWQFLEPPRVVGLSWVPVYTTVLGV